MKKILLYSTLALSVGLCSCSQEDLGENPAQAVGQPVTVSVQLPSEVGGDGLSRDVPEIPADHQLRCILYVSGGDAEPIRQEVVADEASDVITFSFTPPADTYTCSFWADYVKTDANSDGTYDDLYYNTTNLPNVTFADNADLFNNEACDAFTGHFAQDEITSGTPVTLSRPLAKVNFISEEAVGADATVDVTYTVSNGMNISTGAINTAEPQKSLTYNGAVANAADKVLFFNYLFADGENTKLPASISYTLGETSGTIPTNEIPLAANTPYNLSFSTASGEVVTSPAVGDYFFTDGTWSSSLDGNTEKTVAGVVFAVKGDGTSSAIESDETTNYSNAGEATDVLAWVIAAKDASTGANVKFYAGDASMSLPENMGEGKDDIKGYSNTALWVKASETDYEAASTAKAYNVEITGDTKTSGWYLPSIGQMLALGKVYAEKGENDTTTSLAVKKSFEALTAGGGDSAAAMASGNYWTSTGGTQEPEQAGAYRISFANTNYGNALRTGDDAKAGSNVRPILTIFK
ncbi:DUF6562 domain-containing protein [Phocaeicola plebeius]|uniref:DUF6562 domain-containing protein n=1 Tax=Phocaeicola plebeius TaxID=310297 RepID=UPI0026F1A13E|nr:DUF6562 domain-containing protein [Phocaeicola plebeius]